MELTFNTAPRPPLRVNPKTLVVIGAHKIRKTLTLSKLPGALLLETDPDGASYITCLAFDFDEEYWKAVVAKQFSGDGSLHSKLAFLEQVVIPQLQAKRPARRLIIDTIDEIEDWIVADLNRKKNNLLLAGGSGKDKSPSPLESIVEMSYGTGHALIAERFVSLWGRLAQCADELIFVCHIKRNFDPADPTGAKKDISSDIDLRGQVRKIPCKLGAAVCALKQVRKDTLTTQLWGSFRSGPDTAGGTRILHLDGRDILLSECRFAGAKDANGIVTPKIDPATNKPIVEAFTTFWESVYIDAPAAATTKA